MHEKTNCILFMKTPIVELFKSVYGKSGLAAFNVFNAEQIVAVFKGAELAGKPVIVQVTPVARNYLGPELLDSCIHVSAKQHPDVRFSVHLDHGNYEHCADAIKSGYYNSVMIDASHEQFMENVRITKEIVDMAHAKGIAVEAELGVLSGVEDTIDVDEKSAFYTDPDQAREFVQRTNCDSLAIAIGTSHGAYKDASGAGLQLDVLSRIQQNLPGFPLVLHGASAVPVNEVERINQSGGRLKQSAKGIQVSDVRKAVGLGVCKINIATDLRLIWARVHREFFKENPEKFDLVVPGTEYIKELSAFVAKRINDYTIEKQN